MAGFRNDVLFGQATELTNTANDQFQSFTDGVNTWGYFKSNGSPEGVVTADKGSICSDVVNGDIYYKTTNSANTGWSLLSGAGSTALPQYSVALGTGVSSLSSVGPSATVGAILQSAGNASDPVFSTAAYPSTSTQGDILYSSAANTIVGLAKDANATRYLSNTGASNNPAWAQVDLTNGVTGTLPVANGGTGRASFATVNGIVLGNGTSALGLTGAGTAGQIFVSNSPSAPAFASSTAADFSFTNATAATARTLTVSHSDNTSTSSTANYTASVGGTSAGDAWYQASVGSSRSYAWGIDNTDSQALKMATAAAATVSPSSTALWKMTSAGEMTVPLQPCFMASLSTNQLNVTGDGTLYTVIYDTEIEDRNGDYNNATGTFTAPVTGTYLLGHNPAITGLGAGFGLYSINVATTGRSISMQRGNASNAYETVTGGAGLYQGCTVIAPMTAGDTATFTLSVGTNTKTVDITATAGSGNTASFCWGFLLG